MAVSIIGNRFIAFLVPMIVRPGAILLDSVLPNPNHLPPKSKQAASNKALTKATVCVLISFPERRGIPSRPPVRQYLIQRPP